MGPALSYEEIITTIEGPRALPIWLLLAAELEARGGWRFRINTDALPVWERRRRPWIWATAQSLRPRPAVFVVWRAGADPDDVDDWEIATIAGLRAALDALELPRGVCREALRAITAAEAPRMAVRPGAAWPALMTHHAPSEGLTGGHSRQFPWGAGSGG